MGESTIVQGALNTITVSLQPNHPLPPGTSITLSGLVTTHQLMLVHVVCLCSRNFIPLVYFMFARFCEPGSDRM